jgi:hypothetical protein
MSGICRTTRGKIHAYRLLVGNPEGERSSPGRLRRKWKDNIKTDLKETGCNDVD